MDMVGENMMFAWLHTYIGLSTKVLYERFYNKLLYSGFSWGGFPLSGFYFLFFIFIFENILQKNFHLICH